jgi:aminoglycoside phosphotransferase (APT) family kinase protein
MAPWTSDPGESELRGALAHVDPELASLPMRINPRPMSDLEPIYRSASAWIGDRFVVKYAWSEIRAERLMREVVLLDRMRARPASLPVPEVVVASEDPAFFMTAAAAGAPLSWEVASSLSAVGLSEVADQLGGFLARLHGLSPTELLAGLPAVVPRAQATTQRLRADFPRIVDEPRGRTVLGWCDWVDDVLTTGPAPVDVIVHGDLHGHNQVWDPATSQLQLVVDLEECGLHDPHFDLRYLPGNAASLDLARAVAAVYSNQSGRDLRMERVMAWHVLTHLGDALWRTEAGVDLPGGGDARSWVDDLGRRMTSP